MQKNTSCYFILWQLSTFSKRYCVLIFQHTIFLVLLHMYMFILFASGARLQAQGNKSQWVDRQGNLPWYNKQATSHQGEDSARSGDQAHEATTIRCWGAQETDSQGAVEHRQLWVHGRQGCQEAWERHSQSKVNLVKCFIPRWWGHYSWHMSADYA